MKIAVLGTRYSPPFFRGGEERVIYELKKQFEKRGHRVNVFVPQFKKYSDIDARSAARDVTRIPVHDVRFFYNLEFSRKCGALLARDPHDIILNTHTHLGCHIKRGPLLLLVATSSYGERRAVKIRGFGGAVETIARMTLGVRADRKVYRSSSHIICVHGHIKDEIVKRYNIPEARISVIGNGVDCHYYCPEASQRPGRGSDDTIVTFAGRLANRKNIDLLLEAGALIKKGGGRLNIRVVGDGAQRKRLEKLAGSLGIADITEFTGRKNGAELLHIYQSSDIFVLPSRYEGMPLVLLEAQACGLPAVVTDFSGARSIIKDGENGYVTRTWKADELAERLGVLIKNTGLRLEMSKKARAQMEKYYSWDVVADNFLNLFESIKEGT